MHQVTSKVGSQIQSRSAVAVVMTVLATLCLVACDKAKLVDLKQAVLSTVTPNGVKVNFCTDPAFDQKLYLKTIVILDHSGSNQQNYKMDPNGTGAPALVNGSLDISTDYATDPDGTTRYGTVATPGTLLNYLSTLPANDATDPTRFFALVNFNAQATTYPANASGFTSNVADFYARVLADSQSGTGKPTDGGSTSYVSALDKAYTIMRDDVNRSAQCAALPKGSNSPGSWCPRPGSAVASSYVVVFMSDGSPITAVNGVGTDSNGNTVVTGDISIQIESTTRILGTVGSMMALASNPLYVSSVNLFTIYYYKPGNADLNGQALLEKMAKAGNGIAYNALSGSNIDYEQFQPPAKKIKYTLSDIFVSNSSVTWWTDGQMHLDSDQDGLPDDIETQFGTNKLKKYSYTNGISDLVKYRLANGVCASKNGAGVCQDTVVNYKANGQRCASITSNLVAGSEVFKSSDPGGMNDCEKLLLGNLAGVGSPDSNNDSIPDWLEFVNALPFQVGTSPSINVIGQDGYTVYQKIKRSLPLNVGMPQMLNYTPSNYALSQISTSTTQDCYQLNVANLPMVGENNVVRVDVIEKTPLLPNLPLYRVGKKAFATGSEVIEFADWNNAAEQALSTWSISQ
jgi:hypothetical protein